MGLELIPQGSKFGLTNETLRIINDAIQEHYTGIARLAGGLNSIIWGMTEYVGPGSSTIMLTDGFIAYNGEFLDFQGGVKYDYVQVVTEVIERPYLTSGGLVNQPAYRKRYAKCVPAQTGVSFSLANLDRLKSVKELTDLVNSNPLFTQVLLDKINSIETGAERNVQSDWSTEGTTSDTFIKNKPQNLVKYRNTTNLTFVFYGDGTTWTVPHNIGNSNYQVLAELELNGVATFANTPGFVVTVYDRTDTDFKVKIKRVTNSPDVQMRCRLKIQYN